MDQKTKSAFRELQQINKSDCVLIRLEPSENGEISYMAKYELNRAIRARKKNKQTFQVLTACILLEE